MRETLLVGLAMVCLLQACAAFQFSSTKPSEDGVTTSALLVELSLEELAGHSALIINVI